MLPKKVALFLATVLYFSNAHAADGAKLYSEACASCHGDKMDGNGPIGAALKPKPKSLKGYTVAQLIQVMKTAKKIDGDKGEIALMVGIKSQLKNDEERKAVADYIVSKLK
ncbi:c-type cytochrome [Silvanigrella aquatica]|uniref:Cytochrome c domain-containing protein n=1 Tax=Silvanigrella aquatica TaxID=1915309 RepID=A0A1L4D1M2_9BACT|nr:cytochrome c [Silvanigrella aquatica]APJ04090.1 hypothetical protein AXG55_09290 [Silvanigrella aquatica]